MLWSLLLFFSISPSLLWLLSFPSPSPHSASYPRSSIFLWLSLSLSSEAWPGVTDHGDKLWQGMVSGTKLSFSLSTTFSHLCPKLNQPIWKSNSIHFISLLNAVPQSLPSFPRTPSPSCTWQPGETTNFTPSSTDEAALWLFSASNYSHNTSVKPVNALYLSKSQCDATSHLARKRCQVRR